MPQQLGDSEVGRSKQNSIAPHAFMNLTIEYPADTKVQPYP